MDVLPRSDEARGKALKRTALVLLALLGLSGRVFASPCTSVQDGDWTNAATWGGSACAPTASDTVTINHVVGGNFTGTVTLSDLAGSGTLNMVAGNRRFDVASQSNWRGTFNLANGTWINWTAGSGTPGWELGDTGALVSDATNLGPLRSVVSFASSPTSGVCISGNRWTVGVSPAPAGLVPGDLAQFMNWNGAAFGRMYEIVQVSGSLLTLCPALPDANSLGPRLTPHKPTSAIPQPGVSPQQIPAVGDTLLAWHPWKMTRSGAAPWWIVTGTANPVVSRIELVGGDLSGASIMDIQCAANQPPLILSHSNVHDGNSTGMGSLFRLTEGTPLDSGCHFPLASFNVFHDNAVELGGSEIMITRSGSHTGHSGDGGALVANTFYRTNNNIIQVNFSDAGGFIHPFEVSYNTCFELGTSGSGECSCVEIDDASDVTAQFNRAWNLSTTCGGFDRAGFENTLYKNNLWIGNFVDGGGWGMDVAAPPFQGGMKNNAAVNNYVAHTLDQAISASRAHYNLVRRWSDGNTYQNEATRSYAGIWARQAEGNVMDGAGSARAAIGIWTEEAALGGVPGRYLNNVFFGLATDQFHGATGIAFSMGFEVADVTIKHNFMECGTTGFCYGVARMQGIPRSTATYDVTDNVVLGSSGSFAATSEVGSRVVDNLMNLTRYGGIGPAYGTWSSKSGEVERDPKIVAAGSDWNYRATSLELFAGAAPPFSSIGIRGRRFDPSLFPPFLIALMGAIPPDTENETLDDFDLDLFPAFALDDPDSPDLCPAITDLMNGLGGSSCDNLNSP
jgi:hypothetical protein